MSFSHIKLGKKLALAFGVALATVMLICGAVLFEQQVSIDVAGNAAKSNRVILDAQRALAGLFEQNASVRGLLLMRQSRFVDRFKAAAAGVDEALADAHAAAAGDTVLTTSIDKTSDAIRAWQAGFGNNIVAMALDDSRRDEATGLATSELSLSAFDKVRTYAARTVDKANAKAAQAETDQVRAYSIVRLVLIVGIGVAALVMGLAWFWLKRGIAAPIVSMTAAMKSLAAGDTTTTVPAVGRRDEVGDMANALQAFKDAAIAQRRIEAEATASREAVAREQARAAALEAEAAEEQGRVVSALADGLDRLSKGDLGCRIEAALAPAYEKLRHDFNAAIGTLRETMSLVASNTGAIRSGTTEIAAAAQDLARRTEQQAATLEETAAALEEITTTVGKTASGALHAREVVTTTRTDAEASGTVVREAVEAMASIEQSSRQIGQIIGLIDEIAFQTNLLALNAGVEAARAGEAGRGFAVVASEVRGLAQRSAEAAKEIKALVKASDAHVGRGVALVGQTGEVLARMLTQVVDIHGIVGHIAASAQEQATALREVSIAVTQMDQVTQQNAAMVEETTAASRSLAGETDALADLIDRFELGQDGPVVSARRAPRAAAPALKATGTDGRVAAVDDGGWTEF